MAVIESNKSQLQTRRSKDCKSMCEILVGSIWLAINMPTTCRCRKGLGERLAIPFCCNPSRSMVHSRIIPQSNKASLGLRNKFNEEDTLRSCC